MTLFEILFAPTIIGAMILGYYSVKNKWRIADYF
jgi:hypothetical protein